ncbi:hypothetical protein HK405_010008, partial [Cladochytrium tenue]
MVDAATQAAPVEQLTDAKAASSSSSVFTVGLAAVRLVSGVLSMAIGSGSDAPPAANLAAKIEGSTTVEPPLSHQVNDTVERQSVAATSSWATPSSAGSSGKPMNDDQSASQRRPVGPRRPNPGPIIRAAQSTSDQISIAPSSSASALPERQRRRTLSAFQRPRNATVLGSVVTASIEDGPYAEPHVRE